MNPEEKDIRSGAEVPVGWSLKVQGWRGIHSPRQGTGRWGARHVEKLSRCILWVEGREGSEGCVSKKGVKGEEEEEEEGRLVCLGTVKS
ncbi:uncharacterized protein Bfra_001496 [Botrytis fragariae]|uniref:Uncharacterized protein n=1 Tax=Botrytis fragariae TaxID=1964551 RepID=A0A8H6B0F9_9HELO|nr:uncharacterized protein Bfra_001496 [Botrytis fragariae]KAF5877133.1 hypothetical protein Bfra_001496 [Botrytis fragariae]